VQIKVKITPLTHCQVIRGK